MVTYGLKQELHGLRTRRLASVTAKAFRLTHCCMQVRVEPRTSRLRLGGGTEPGINILDGHEEPNPGDVIYKPKNLVLSTVPRSLTSPSLVKHRHHLIAMSSTMEELKVWGVPKFTGLRQRTEIP